MRRSARRRWERAAPRPLTVPATKGSVQVRAQFTPTDTANHLGSTSPTLTVTVK